MKKHTKTLRVGIFFLIFLAFSSLYKNVSAATICSSSTNQACSYTSDCSMYPNGTLCEKNVNGCNTSSSGNNVYSCQLGKWVYQYWTQNGSCNFCSVITPPPPTSPTFPPSAPLVTSSACLYSEAYIDGVGCVPTDPVKFVTKFYGIGLSVLAALALLCIIFGGYIILTSQGNASKIQFGKRYIYYSIIGLLLAIFAGLIMQVVFGDVLKIPGFTK